MKNTNRKFNRPIDIEACHRRLSSDSLSIDSVVVVISTQYPSRTNFNLVPIAVIRQQQRRRLRSWHVALRIAQSYTS
jgi:hypothetical protein